MLAFPRSYVRARIDLEACIHAGNYAPGDPVCAHCADWVECSWLYKNDAFSGLSEKHMVDLIEALDFAVDFVDASSYRSGHPPKADCRCDVCVWLQGARRLYDQASATK
jgi:hypothetical protein